MAKLETREQIEAELRRRGWRYVAPPAQQFKAGRWHPVKSKGLWFRPAKQQAEFGGKVRGLLFVNAALEAGIDPEPLMPLIHSRYLAMMISGQWRDGMKILPSGRVLVDIEKRTKHILHKV